MLATFLVPIPLAVLSFVPVTSPTRDCNLEVLTPPATEVRTMHDLDARLHAYVALRRRLIRSMGVAMMPDDEGGFFGNELREVIVAARPQARQGEFFTPAISTIIGARIDRALLRGVTPQPGRLYEPLLGEPAPKIGAGFPLVPGTVIWPALFNELPGLPPELGYALWGRSLVLVDRDANLVLDVLPEALPAGVYSSISR
jgi:hypothetical protein